MLREFNLFVRRDVNQLLYLGQHDGGCPLRRERVGRRGDQGVCARSTRRVAHWGRAKTRARSQLTRATSCKSNLERLGSQLRFLV